MPGHVPGCATQCMRYSEALPRLKDGKRYPDTNGRLLVTKLRVNLSFVNVQVSSTVLCGPTYTDPYYPLTHEHGW